ATSPPAAIRPRSANTSRWRWSRAARLATAAAPLRPTRCAAASARSRSSATISSTPKGAACMARSSEVERLSPLAPVYRAGPHGNFDDGVGVALSEPRPGSIVQLAAWPGQERRMIEAIRTVTGLALPDGAGGGVYEAGKAAFGFAPGKF